MATITFRAKVERIYNVDDTFAFDRIKVPTFTRSHVNMSEFRVHPRYGGIANSQLFPSALARIRRERLGDYIRLDRIPEGVTIDTSGFLASVSLSV